MAAPDPARIVVAAGSEEIRHRLAAAMRRGGHEPIVAISGRAVLRDAYARSPRLVVLDAGIQRPGVWETLDRLREGSAIPILLLLDEDHEGERAMLAGADDHLVGNVTDTILLARVRVLLRRRSAAWPSPPPDSNR